MADGDISGCQKAIKNMKKINEINWQCFLYDFEKREHLDNSFVDILEEMKGIDKYSKKCLPDFECI